MMLKTLAEAAGISGAEDEVRELVISAIEDHVDEWRVDAMGNVLALKKGTGQQPLKVMIAAHMDEVGFMVVGHDSNGLLIVKAVGGIDAKLLPALRVKVGTDQIPGVFVWTPIHLNGNENVVSINDMRIDIGVTSKDAAKDAAPIGTSVIFDSRFVELSDTIVRCKALDDRAGCSELIDLCQGERLPFDLHACFTVQEEVGLRGALVLAETIEPDFAIVLEATACHEVPQDPDEPDQTTVTRLGQGPAISYMDRTSIVHPGLLRHFVGVAKELGIPHQFRSPQYAGGNDAGSIHKSWVGVPCLSVSLPCRYLHAPHSIISLNDYNQALRLVREALLRMTPAVLERQ